MNYSDLLDECAAALKAAGISNFRNESRWLILETLEVPVSVFYDRSAVDTASLAAVRERCNRRCSHEPLQYILGSAPFAELELAVTPDVLIPRSETVCLVECALKYLPENGTLLDVGCGSGAISLLAAYRRKDISVTALDKSVAALNIARQNARTTGVEKRVRFCESNLTSALNTEKFHVIAANLPYVTFEEYAALDAGVRDFEPEMALTAPDDGMALINQLISEAPQFLLPGGALVLEMSPAQTDRAGTRLKKCGFENISSFPDQFGRERFVFAQWMCRV